MKRVLLIVGIIIFSIGIMGGDSDNLLIPLILIVVGGLLMKIGGVFNDDYGEYEDEF